MMRRARLALAGGSALGVVVLLLAGFVWPDVDREVDLGRVEAFAPGSVTSFYRPVGGEGFRLLAPGETVENTCTRYNGAYPQRLSGTVIHVVRLGDGEIRAFSGRSPHLWDMVPWLPDFSYNGSLGWFREPCHAETFAMDGTRVYGPTPRDLDRFALRIEDGRVFVDVTDVTEGERGR